MRSRRVVLTDGVRQAQIEIVDGRIAAVSYERDLSSTDDDVLDVGDLVVMPGLVDTHVHLNDPGRAEWEGFRTGTRAAVAGGVTTVIDMPLNSVPATTSLQGLRAKQEAARGCCWVDVGFWGGIVPGNGGELRGLHDAGVFGFKCFLVPSGVEEFPHVGETDLRAALPELQRLRSLLLVHAEDPDTIIAAARGAERGGASSRPVGVPPQTNARGAWLGVQGSPPFKKSGDPRSYAAWLATRPPAAERRAIELMIALCEEFQTRVHIVHVSASESVGVLADARRRGLPISAETCPHYLFFCAEGISDGRPAFKCAPPIRERSHADRLWTALADGDLSMIVSDHSPAPPGLKALDTGDLFAAWGGISSLQLSLPAVWTASRPHGASLEDISRWMSAAPARLVGLDDRKGTIARGADADLVIWDPGARWRVDARTLQHRHPVTPYDGLELEGQVGMTIVGGRIAYRDGQVADAPSGRLLRRTDA